MRTFTLACRKDTGRSVFNDLLFRRRECVFFAFDLLFLNGEDLRALLLIERKARLKQLLRRKRSPVLYVEHIEARGRQFFDKVCELDLEGIVAKRQTASYRATEKPSPYWIKIKNRSIRKLKAATSCSIRSRPESLEFDRRRGSSAEGGHVE